VIARGNDLLKGIGLSNCDAARVSVESLFFAPQTAGDNAIACAFAVKLLYWLKDDRIACRYQLVERL